MDLSLTTISMYDTRSQSEILGFCGKMLELEGVGLICQDAKKANYANKDEDNGWLRLSGLGNKAKKVVWRDKRKGLKQSSRVDPDPKFQII